MGYTVPKETLLAMIAGLLLTAPGCPATGVGDPCSPETHPEGGFTENDTVVEVNSIQCRTRTCMVYNLESFCTHRCDEHSDCNADWNESGPGQDDVPRALCEAEVEVGSEAVQGSYCVPAYASKD